MCYILLCSGIYLMHKPRTWSAEQKDDGNQKKKMKSLLAGRMWERSVFQPPQRVSSCPWSPKRNFTIMLWHPLCASQPPWPSFHQAHSAPHTLVSVGWRALMLAGSSQRWIQQLFRSFILVGVTELMEAERLQEIASFQEIKGFWLLLHGYSSPCLFLISLSFPRNIVAVEIYLWKHFAGGALKYEWFSVKSLGGKKKLMSSTRTPVL